MKRFTPLILAAAVMAGAILLAILSQPWRDVGIVVAVLTALLVALGVRDMIQTRHAILRNYPILGHMRWLFEGVRPEIRQYLIESDADELPFSREARSLVYQRAKGQEDARPFGTREKVYEAGFSWLNHSVDARHLDERDFRITVGGPNCKQPYSASIYNISGMSFGSLSANAISALNLGAKMGGFAHDTGEGGISRYHRQGGDLVFQVGTGYFGCRDA